MEQKFIGWLFGVGVHSPFQQEELDTVVQAQIRLHEHYKVSLKLTEKEAQEKIVNEYNQFCSFLSNEQKLEFDELHAHTVSNAPAEWFGKKESKVFGSHLMLNSPLTSEELLKIDTYIKENIELLSQLSFEYFENIRLFQPKITNFDQYLSELTVNEKTRAWTYLFATAKKKRKPRTSKAIHIEPSHKFEIQEPEKRNPYGLIGIIFLCAVILGGILYATKNNDDKPSAEQGSIQTNNLKEVLPKKINEFAYSKYTKDQFPRLYATWGDDWVGKLPEFERQAAQKIANESNSCDSIDMVALSENRSTPQKEAIFFVDCANGERFYVSQNDFNSSKEIRSQTEKAISQSTAFENCRQLIKANTKYPSSVNFKLLDSSGFTAKTTGNVVVVLGFEAKNSFGADMPAKAKCIFTPDGEKEINITEE